jgi:hypothetical protein
MKYLIFINLITSYFSFAVEEVEINGSLDISQDEEDINTNSRTFGIIAQLLSSH